MKLRNTLFSLIVAISATLQAQDGLPVYHDYFADNLYLLHPSMAGASSYGKLRMTARQQWFDQTEAPNIQTASYHNRVGQNSGLGAIVFNDANGYHSQVGGYLTYAHHLLFSRNRSEINQLSFGMSVGLMESKLDETNFDPSQYDPIIAGIIQTTGYFNVDAGMSYNFLDFSAHFTVKNLLFRNRSLYSEEFESNNQRNYILSMAYGISGSGGLYYFEPSFMLQYKERTQEQGVDLNFKAFRAMEFGSVYAGLSYRRSFDGAEYLDGNQVRNQKLQYITPVIGTTYKNFMFAYTYSYQTGSVRLESGGFHQITIGYNFLRGRFSSWDQDMRYNGMLRPKY